MRNNQPVTNNEQSLRDDAVIISRTNSKGMIVDCNEEFVVISGYTRDELIGQPHNILRHPDMPTEAFRDMWETLKNGRPWSGIVKNRCKNGDFYWVRATATPMGDNSGYVSVRFKPSIEEVRVATQLYQRMNADKNVRLCEGQVVQSSVFRTFSCIDGVRKLLTRLQYGVLAMLIAIAGTLYLPLDAIESRTAITVLAGLCALAIMTIGIPKSNKIYRTLSDAGNAAKNIAAGDLTVALPHAGKDEIGELIARINIMRNNLIELVASVHQNVESVHQAAGELTAASHETKAATVSQSEAASNIAASVEQLTVSIKLVEDHSKEAIEMTLMSAKQSEEGGHIIHNTAEEMQKVAEAVHETAETIRSLETLSSNISNIIKVINDIAEQTNLLALNAAIEAARAGEQGRGFAVVADEVRKLAERTTNSTLEIVGVIDQIKEKTLQAVAAMQLGVSRVSDGVELAQQAGISITGIQETSAKVAQTVDGISLALREQVNAVHDMAQRLEKIAQGAEENSSSATQTASSTMELELLAKGLTNISGRFKIV